MNVPLRVVVADDHPPTRATVREALEEDGCTVVAEVADAQRAVEAAGAHRPDVCLLDIHMPGSGIAAAAAITHDLPETAVVMLTASRDDRDMFDALRAGASGYLLKDMDPARLPAALRGVLAGEAALPLWLVRKVAEQFDDGPARRSSLEPLPRTRVLTPREAEILALMSSGLSTEEIGHQLFVAPVTVRTHIAAILKKLHAPSREAAIRMTLDARGGDRGGGDGTGGVAGSGPLHPR
jgi:two-component system, NarL family, nitrate/nitrite response regulator NarL